MLSTTNVSSICISTSTSNITQLTAEGGTMPRWCRTSFSSSLFLLMFLPLQVLSISLWSCTADLTYITVMKLLGLRWCLRFLTFALHCSRFFESLPCVPCSLYCCNCCSWLWCLLHVYRQWGWNTNTLETKFEVQLYIMSFFCCCNFHKSCP